MEEKQSSHAHLMAMLTHDLLSLTFFLISHPLHFAYLLFFSPYLLSLLSFLCPLLISTSLFLLTLLTISPYLGKSPSQFKLEDVGKICSIALNALCPEPELGDHRTIALLEELDEMVISPITQALVGSEVCIVSVLSSSTLVYKDQEGLLKDSCEDKLRNCSILEDPLQINSFIDKKCELIRDPDHDKGPNNENVQNTMEFKDMDQEFYNAEEKIPINVNLDNSTCSNSSLVGNGVFLNLYSQNSNHSNNSSVLNNDLKELDNEFLSPDNGGRIGEKLSKSMSLNQRVHTRSLSQGLQREGSMKVEREWKRTLACKLYEERMCFKLRDERSLKVPLNEREEGGEEMDLLWEAIEVNSNKSNGNKNGLKSKGKDNVEREEEEESEEEEGEEGDEGHVRQLCCLQALRVSTRKMNLGVGRPNLVKFSKVLKKMSIFHGVGRNRGKKE